MPQTLAAADVACCCTFQLCHLSGGKVHIAACHERTAEPSQLLEALVAYVKSSCISLTNGAHTHTPTCRLENTFGIMKSRHTQTHAKYLSRRACWDFNLLPPPDLPSRLRAPRLPYTPSLHVALKCEQYDLRTKLYSDFLEQPNRRETLWNAQTGGWGVVKLRTKWQWYQFSAHLKSCTKADSHSLLLLAEQWVILSLKP